MREFFLHNGSYKVVALLITLILWVTVLGSKDLTLNKPLKLDFVLPSNAIISNPVPDQIQVQISGSRLSLKKIYKGLNPLTIDLRGAKVGKTVTSIPIDEISLPFGSKILSVNPSSVVVDIDRIILKWIPIKIDWVSEAKTKKILNIRKINPTGVQVKGAASVLSRLDTLWTEPVDSSQIDLESKQKTFEIKTQLKDLNIAGLLPLDDKSVTISVRIKK